MVNEQQKKNAQTASRNDFVAGVVTELRLVTWPTRDEWVTATVLTIGLVVGIGLFTFALDELFGHLFTLIRPAGL